MADLIVPPALRAVASQRARALPRDRARRHPRQAARAVGRAQERRRVPGRADDHADRAARRRRRSPATCATSPTGSAPKTSCAPRAPVWSRSPTPNGGGSSATSTTARSSGSRPLLLTIGRLRSHAVDGDRKTARRCRSTSSRPASTSCASWRAGSIRQSSPSAGSSPRSRRSRCARRSRSSSPRCPTGSSPSRSRRPPTTSSPRRSRTCRSTRAQGTSSSRATCDDGRLVVEVVDDGAGGADPEGEGLRGLVDRVEALGGTLQVDSPTGQGTRVRARFPSAELSRRKHRPPGRRALPSALRYSRRRPARPVALAPCANIGAADGAEAAGDGLLSGGAIGPRGATAAVTWPIAPMMTS